MPGDRYRRLLALAALGLVPTMGTSQQPKAAQPGQPLRITVTTATPAPDVSLSLGNRTAKVTPARTGCTHTGGGNIDVQQPSPDTIVITMSGVALAYGGLTGPAVASQLFEFVQQFEVTFDKPTVKAAKLTIDGRLIGALRSHKFGSAEVCAGATVSGASDSTGLALVMPSHTVSGGENASINDNNSPAGVGVRAAKYTLNQNFKVTATMPRSLLPSKAPSAEFAPDPALDPLWISSREPFHGVKKTDFGFQITIKVTPDDPPQKK